MIYCLAEVWISEDYSLMEAKMLLRDIQFEWETYHHVTNSHHQFNFLITDMYETIDVLGEGELVKYVFRIEEGVSDIEKTKKDEIKLDLKTVLL